MLYRITAPHFVAGFAADSFGRVRDAAPILKFMFSWSLHDIEEYCKHKTWVLEQVNLGL